MASGKLFHVHRNSEELIGELPAENKTEEICRVCRGTSRMERPLFHPCLCTGSIKYVHQDCLVQWLQHSGKSSCEVCQHRFEFTPIYREDMPSSLPMLDFFRAITQTVLGSLKHWVHLFFVLLMWLFIVPTCIYRVYRFLMYRSLWLIFQLPMDLISLNNLLLDCLYGIVVLLVSLLGFLSLVWLKDQLNNGLGRNWLEENRQKNDLIITDENRAYIKQFDMLANDRHQLSTVVTSILKLFKTFNTHSIKLINNFLIQFRMYNAELRLKEFQLLNSLNQTFLSSNYFLQCAVRKQYKGEDSIKPVIIANSEDTGLQNDDIPKDILKDLKQVWVSQCKKVLEANRFTSICQHDEVLERLNRDIKRLIEKESTFNYRQLDFEVDKNDQRMNRWRNSLLNRQENPLLPRRQRNNGRPNIGLAIADLARDRNPLDVDDIGGNDEISWARLLGLDGSLRFLEHVLWLICLNSALIFGVLYIPFQLGFYISTSLNLWVVLGITNWIRTTSVFIGYISIGFVLFGIYYCCGKFSRPVVKNALGIAYISIKVGMILIFEAGIFPLICGWWIDICSFALFSSTFDERLKTLSKAPGTVTFLHWIGGMIFVFYLASFVLLLREIFRPGVIWFLRNLNDQDFHPIDEMVNFPIHRHLRRFMMSCVLFGVCIILVFFLPSKIIIYLCRTFLPYKLLSKPLIFMQEIHFELVLFQFMIPYLLEHGNFRAVLKIIIAKWASFAANALNLHSYLLDKEQKEGTLVDVHGNCIAYVSKNSETPVNRDIQVLGPGFPPFKPYIRPKYFFLRILLLLCFTFFSVIILSTTILVFPVAVGRYVLHILHLKNAHDIYAAVVGIFAVMVIFKLKFVKNYVTRRAVSLSKLLSYCWITCKYAFTGFILLCVIPLLMGHLVELTLLSALKVPPTYCPVYFFSREWVLGLFYVKCLCGIILLTDISFKHTLNAIFQAGFQNMDIDFILLKVAFPSAAVLFLCIAIPYIGFVSLSSLLSYEMALVMYRYFYPIFLLTGILILFVGCGAVMCRKLYMHVTNEKYLVGRQLVNR